MNDQGLLSSGDVLEIKKFALGRSRIKHLTETLNAWPSIDPFADFVQIEAEGDPTSEAICHVWEALVGKLEKANAWQDERDAIEAEAISYEVGDMERLRQVAKAASERELSPQDTDLIELTVQTLVALDTLLRLLRSRRETLDAYQARLQWEEKRRDCWSSYTSLSQDIDEFVKQARWSPLIYQKRSEDGQAINVNIDESTLHQASNLANCSPETSRSTPNAGLMSTSLARKKAALVKSHSATLSYRCRSFIGELVPTTALTLDELIELQKVPEIFLDEQEKMEDLAENIRSRDVFLIQLSLQWRRADEVYRLLRSLHSEGKHLHVAITSAQREVITLDRLAVFENQTEMLKKKLEGLCGSNAVEHYFNLKDYTISSDRLFQSIESSLPSPHCERWASQDAYTLKLKEQLDSEMCTAAKYARSACQAAARYRRAVSSIEEIKEYTAGMSNLSMTYTALKYQIQQVCASVYTTESEEQSSQSSALLTVHINDLSSIYSQEYEDSIKQLSDLECQYNDLVPRAANQIELLQRGVAACIKHAVPLSNFRGEADEAQQYLELRQKECSRALKESLMIATLAKKVREVSTGLKTLEKANEDLLTRAKAHGTQLLYCSAVNMDDVESMILELDQRKEDHSNIQKMIEGFATELEARNAIIMKRSLLEEVHQQLDVVKSIEGILIWAETVQKQRQEMSALEEQYTALMKDAVEAKRLSSMKDFADHHYEVCLPGEEMETLKQYGQPDYLESMKMDGIEAFVSMAHKRVTLVGPEPDVMIEPTVGKERRPSLDDLMRDRVNEWCALLSSIASEIESNTERARRFKKDHGANFAFLAKEQHRFDLNFKEWDRLHVHCKESLSALMKLISHLQMEDEAGRRQIEQMSILLQSSLRDQRGVLQRLLEFKKSHAMSAGVLSKCQECSDETEETENQYVALSKAVSEALRVNKSELHSVIDASVEWSQDDVMQDKKSKLTDPDQMTREGFNIEEPRRRLNGGKKSALLPLMRKDAKEEQASSSNWSTKREQDVFSGEVRPEEEILSSKNESIKSDIQLRDTVKELLKFCKGGVIDEQTSASGHKQLQRGLNLPTIAQSNSAKSEWNTIKVQVDQVMQQCQSRNLTIEYERLRTLMQVRDAKMRRLNHLATFASKQNVIEGSLSSLLDRIDSSSEGDDIEAVHDQMEEIKALLKEIETVAEPILTDIRIRHQLGQLRHSYQDMAEMAREKSVEDDGESDNRNAILPSRESTHSSLPSLCGSVSEEEEGTQGQRMDRMTSTKTIESMNKVHGTPRKFSSTIGSFRSSRHRANSNASSISSSRSGIPTAIPIATMTPQISYDRRSVSESTAMATPSRMQAKVSSRSERKLPVTPDLISRHASSSSLSVTSQFKTPQKLFYGRPSTAQSHYDLSKKSPFTNKTLDDKTPRATTIRSPSSSATAVIKAKNGKPNQYRANPKSKLDVAVAKIVNKMPMQVEITHATVRDTKAKEQWHDESGRYWVGHPDPKLCFCRILRSRTVMVRIGGGWQELSTYIVKHYAHLAPEASVSVATSPHISPQIERGKIDGLHWTDSSTLIATPITARKASDGGRLQSAKNSPETALLTPLTNIDWKKDSSPRRIGLVNSGKKNSGPMSEPLSRANSPSPILPQQPQFEVEKAGLWIKKERKTSMGISSRGYDGIEAKMRPPIEGLDQTRSTASSRNRRISSHLDAFKGSLERNMPNSRLTSISQRDHQNEPQAQVSNRVASSTRQTPRTSIG